MRKTAVLACALLAGLAVAPALGVAQSRTAVSTGAAPRLINLPRGTSFAVDLPADARDVIVSNPQVAEAMLHSPRRITVIGVTPGETDAVFLDAAGRTILSLRVRVDAGTSALQDTLTRLIPGGSIRAEAVNDTIILTGTATSPSQADQARRVAGAFVSAPEKVINLIGVTGSDQVTVKARIVEVQRTAVKQLGMDVSAVLNTVGDGLALSQTSTFAVNGNLLGGFATIQDAVNAATGGIGERIVVESGALGEAASVGKSVAIESAAGNDTITATGLATVAFTGGAGDDLMAFGAGGGSFDGGAGTDTADFSNIASGVNVNLATGNVSSGPMVATLTGVENVIGSAFNDIIRGDGNANLLQGGDGNDTIAASGGNDTMDGGNGIDTASFGASTAAVFANLVLNTAFGAEVGNNVLVSIENLTGGAGDDALVGNAGNNRLEGGAGNDTLTGGGGDDILVAGTGLDVLFGGSGNDTAVFAGSWAGFDITETGGVFTISRDGNVATVSEVENFIFDGVEYLASEIVNSAPDDIVFTTGAPSVDENADGAAITRLDATDPNPGDTVTLTVDDSRFEIVAAVGPGLPWLLKLKAGETLNYEAEASVTLNIAATDSKGATRVEQLVVTVNDVNEPPEPGPGLGTWTPNAIEAGSVGAPLFPEAGFTDPDGDALTYELLSAPSLGRLLL
ncbi:MAG: pilus assembly protein N-terminal domain-containing protein, partial [Brevundimonas sp.]